MWCSTRASKNIHDKLGDADIVIAVLEHAGLFGASHLKEGAIVIDFGFNRSADGYIIGDFDPSGADEKNIRYTKTPGGTGPVLVAKLFEDLLHSKFLILLSPRAVKLKLRSSSEFVFVRTRGVGF